MARSSEIIVTADMLRRHRFADVAPRWLRDLCGLIAVALVGAAMSLVAIVFTSQSIGS